MPDIAIATATLPATTTPTDAAGAGAGPATEDAPGEAAAPSFVALLTGALTLRSAGLPPDPDGGDTETPASAATPTTMPEFSPIVLPGTWAAAPGTGNEGGTGTRPPRPSGVAGADPASVGPSAGALHGAPTEPRMPAEGTSGVEATPVPAPEPGEAAATAAELASPAPTAEEGLSLAMARSAPDAPRTPGDRDAESAVRRAKTDSASVLTPAGEPAARASRPSETLRAPATAGPDSAAAPPRPAGPEAPAVDATTTGDVPASAVAGSLVESLEDGPAASKESAEGPRATSLEPGAPTSGVHAPSPGQTHTRATAELPPVRVHDRQFPEAFAARVHLAVTQGEPRAEIRVHPAELGPVSVAVEMAGDQANLYFAAQRHETREAIENALPRLRELLAQSGLQLGQAFVGAEAGARDSEGGRPGPRLQAVAVTPAADAGTGASRAPRASASLVDVYA